MLRAPQATKGLPFSENKAKGRSRCVHTLMVAAAIWDSMGRGEDWIEGIQSPSEAEMVDPVEGEMDEIGTEVTVRPEKVTEVPSRRTAEFLLSKDDEDYAAKLRNTLHFMSVYKFPPHIFPVAYLQRLSRNQKKA